MGATVGARSNEGGLRGRLSALQSEIRFLCWKRKERYERLGPPFCFARKPTPQAPFDMPLEVVGPAWP